MSSDRGPGLTCCSTLFADSEWAGSVIRGPCWAQTAQWEVIAPLLAENNQPSGIQMTFTCAFFLKAFKVLIRWSGLMRGKPRCRLHTQKIHRPGLRFLP